MPYVKAYEFPTELNSIFFSMKSFLDYTFIHILICLYNLDQVITMHWDAPITVRKSPDINSSDLFKDWPDWPKGQGYFPCSLIYNYALSYQQTSKWFSQWKCSAVRDNPTPTPSFMYT